MKIKTLTAGERYEIESNSGKTYHITYSGGGDCDGVSLWECDCPAGRHGRDCKHMKAFLSRIALIEDMEDESENQVAEVEA